MLLGFGGVRLMTGAQHVRCLHEGCGVDGPADADGPGRELWLPGDGELEPILCAACGGRGWKWVSMSSRWLVEEPTGLERRSCADCGGPSSYSIAKAS
jgi:hypothetical protein